MNFSFQIYFELLSFLLSLAAFNKLRKTPFVFFIPFLFLTILAEVAGSYVGNTLKLNNHWVYNIFTPIEFVFYSFLFSQYLATFWLKKIVQVFIPFYIIAVLINQIFVQGFFTFHSYTFVIGSMFMVIFVSFGFFDLLKYLNEIPLYKKPFFWFCVGIFFFYLGGTILNVYFDYLRKINENDFKFFYKTINNSLNVILYLCFSASFLCTKSTIK